MYRITVVRSIVAGSKHAEKKHVLTLFNSSAAAWSSLSSTNQISNRALSDWSTWLFHWLSMLENGARCERSRLPLSRGFIPERSRYRAVPANACCPENHLWGSVAPINPHRRWQACAFCGHFGMPLRDMCTAAHGSRSFPKATDGTGT